MNTRRWLLVGAALAVVAAAVPVVAFGVVPLFVRSTLVEPPPPTATPSLEAGGATPAGPAAAARTLSGDLRRIDPVHYGSGRVTLSGEAGSRTLRFEGVDIAGAPNMFVYLSDASDGQPGHFTDLGALKATNGSFNYPVPAAVDVDTIHSVVVWCRAFSVTVTYAPLA
ncbi:MAG: DM13 domain-containing protein [Chloroflexota bacterium]